MFLSIIIYIYILCDLCKYIICDFFVSRKWKLPLTTISLHLSVVDKGYALD